MSIISLQPITDQVRTLHPDTRRECALVVLRQKRPLSAAEQREYDQIIERQEARAYAADLAHDLATEAHAFTTRPNRHDD